MQPPNVDARLLRAAIYARKSNEQDASDEDKSTTRQIENGTKFAPTIGAAVTHVFEDDAISGTEFAKRPDLQRMIDLAKQTPRPFDAVIMSEGSRLGREYVETLYMIKQLIKNDIRVFNYLDGRERTMNTPTEKLMLSLEGFADEMEVFRASQRITDVQMRRAKDGRSNGGRTAYGYRDVASVDAAGRRVVTRTIDPAEAVIVGRIFARAAAGAGYALIAKELNADLVPVGVNATSRTAQIWKIGAVFSILQRTDYRGVMTWRKTRRSDKFQEDKYAARPAADWITAPREDLRIVSDDLWQRAAARRAARAASLPTHFGNDRRARAGGDSQYLLSGFIRCAACGGTMAAVRQNPREYKHPLVYVCRDRRVYGKDRCTFKATIPMPLLDRLVRDRFAAYFTPDTIDAILDDATKSRAPRADVGRWRTELTKTETQMARLASAIADGGDWQILKDKLTTLRARAAELTDKITTAASAMPSTSDRTKARRLLLDAVAGLRGRLQPGDVPATRQLLRDVLQDRPIKVFSPTSRAGVRFRAEADLLMLLVPGALAKPLPDSVLLRLSHQRRTQPYIVLDAAA